MPPGTSGSRTCPRSPDFLSRHLYATAVSCCAFIRHSLLHGPILRVLMSTCLGPALCWALGRDRTGDHLCPLLSQKAGDPPAALSPWEHGAKSEDIFWLSQLRRCDLLSREQAGDTAQQSIMHGTAPQQSYPSPNVNSAEGKNPWPRAN